MKAIGATKEPPALHDTIIACSRHTECVVLMTKCGSDGKSSIQTQYVVVLG
ncbi:hypothetical protein [Sinanaerobacter sp. ZZT-01]|uniref:hypothetical protein n=1 Tax=Sinanaerobacter sp. ZZT-01 TaxID=3111540 RepID=UPI002D7A2E06|nr:hypothetical protein [Sinanaerobacter sp. ZZT-01]WRR93813.1 hypothetical protein U5921_01425 [Sinanaerobacter sp. ZZT-01]